MIERLKNILAERRITPYKLSQGTGISQSTIGRLLKGKTDPNPTTLTAICNYLGISEEWIKTGEGSLRPNREDSVTTDIDLSDLIKSILTDKHKLSELLRAMIRRHDELMEDEFYQLFIEKLANRLERQDKLKLKEEIIKEIQQDAKELYKKDKEVNK